MANVRKRHTAEFKTKAALEAIRQQKTIKELTAEYGVHGTQVNNWKKQALAAIPGRLPVKTASCKRIGRRKLTNCTVRQGC